MPFPQTRADQEPPLFKDKVPSSQVHFDRFVEISPDLICVAGFDGYFRHLSPSWQQVTGFTVAELKARPFIDFVHPEDRPATDAEAARIATGAVTLTFQNRYRRKDGGWVWLQWTAAPYRDESLIYAVARDVTEQVRLLSTIREGEERYRMLFDLMEEGVVLHVPDGRIVTCNRAAERILGLPGDMILGRTPLDPRWRAIREDGSPYPGEEHPAMRTLRTGECLRGEIMGLRLLDEGERWISINTQPVCRGGVVEAVVASFTDITAQRAAEGALRASEERFDLAVRGTDLGVWDWDLVTGKVHYSTRWKSMLGHSPEEIGDGLEEWSRRVHPDDLERAKSLVQAHLEGREAQYSAEFRMKRKDGSWVWILARGMAVRDGEGRPIRVVGSHSDISDRKLAEAKVAAQRGISRALSEQPTFAEAVREVVATVCRLLDWDTGGFWKLDGEGGLLRLVECWAREPLACEAFLADSWRKSFAPGKGLPGHVLASGSPAWIPDVTRDENFLRAPVASSCGLRSAVAFPVRSGGRILGVLEAFSREIRRPDSSLLQMLDSVGAQLGEALARRQSEEALRESEARSRAVTETAVDGILTITDRGIVESVNEAALHMFGYERNELLAENVRKLMPEPFRSAHDGYLSAYLSTGAKKIIGIGREVVGVRKDGVQIPLWLSVSEIRLPEKRLFTGFLHDLTERKKADRIKDEFVSSVSHELRTPLTSIVGTLGLLEGGVAGPLGGEAVELVRIAHQNSRRLVRLINDILDFDKLESGKLEFHLRAVEAGEPVRTAIRENAGYGAEFGVTLELLDDLGAGAVRADPDRLVQVLNNLISNAVKFSPRGSAVEVALARSAAGIRISVRDRGPGIPEEFRSRIFQRFAQADPSDRRRAQGTGLGLGIARAMIERMDGTIGFDTVSGAGTTFWIELPEAEAPRPPAPPPSTRRILVCEDDPDIRYLLQLLFRQAGLESDTAATAAQAEEKLASGAYDAMTLDLSLPDRDGVSLLQDLRSRPATSSLPVVVVSASADRRRERMDGGALGILDWLSKPIDGERLVGAVRQALERQPRQGRPRVLHVEDEPGNRKIVVELLRDLADTEQAGSLAAARERLAVNTYDLVVLDLELPDGSGLDLLPALGATPVLVFSASEPPESAARRLAASLVKTRTTNEELRDTILSLLRQPHGRTL